MKTNDLVMIAAGAALAWFFLRRQAVPAPAPALPAPAPYITTPATKVAGVAMPPQGRHMCNYYL